MRRDLQGHLDPCYSRVKVQAPPGNLLEMQRLRSHSDLLNQNLHSNKIPRYDVCMLVFKKCRSRPAPHPVEKSYLRRLPLGLPLSAQKSLLQALGYRSMIPKFDCTLKSLGDLLKIPMLRPRL